MKLFKRTLLPMMLVLIMALGYTFTIHADENSSYDYTYVSTGETGLLTGDVRATLFNVKDLDGHTQQAYCVDRSTFISTGSCYSRVNVGDADYYSNENAAHIRAIVKNSYPFISMKELKSLCSIEDLTTEEAITATQLAIWHFSNDDSEQVNNTKVMKLKKWYINLEMAESASVPIGNVKVDSKVSGHASSYTATYKYSTDAINVDGTPVKLSYSFDKDIKKLYPGINITDDQNGTVTVSDIPNDASFTFTASGIQNVDFDGYFYDPQGGRNASQSLVGTYSGNTSISKSVEFAPPTTENNTLKLLKIDSVTGDYLEGAVFEIANTPDFDDVVYTVTTGSDGIAIQSGLATGKWYVRETKSPIGYICYEKPFVVSIGAGVTIAECKNTAYGAIEILKTDENGTPLEGAEFSIYSGDKATGTPLFEGLISDENGSILAESIEPGTYTVVETKAPEDYHPNTEPMVTTIKAGEKSIVTCVNESIKPGIINMYKRDAITGELLSGAVIAVFTDEACITQLASFDSSADDCVSTDELKPGNYYVKEIKAPDGYLNDSTPQHVEIHEGEHLAVTFYDNPVPKTAGNYGAVLVIGAALMIICAVGAFIFRKKLIKR